MLHKTLKSCELLLEMQAGSPEEGEMKRYRLFVSKVFYFKVH